MDSNLYCNESCDCEICNRVRSLIIEVSEIDDLRMYFNNSYPYTEKIP